VQPDLPPLPRGAAAEAGPLELNTARAFDLIDAIAEVAKPVFVLSGASRCTVPTCSTSPNTASRPDFGWPWPPTARWSPIACGRIADSGISRVAISLDGAVASTHDSFRGVPGRTSLALRALQALRGEGVSVQINSTIAKHNVTELPALLDLALEIGADALHLFMLVPVGCGLEIAPAQMLPGDEYERVLHWFDEQSKTCPIDLKATCAPHYYRIRAQRLADDRRRGDMTTTFIAPGTKAKAAPMLLHGAHGHHHGQHLSAMTRGCLAGTSVCFVSNEGRVYPCGYLPVSAGDTRVQRFKDIWTGSEVFEQLRNPQALQGKCGQCRYDAICGGCRARAYAETGSFLAEEPFCTYRPELDRRGSTPEEGRHDQQMH
jgi:radical SAM protein with 4Fe4S-binding SPASM domain